MELLGLSRFGDYLPMDEEDVGTYARNNRDVKRGSWTGRWGDLVPPPVTHVWKTQQVDLGMDVNISSFQIFPDVELVATTYVRPAITINMSTVSKGGGLTLEQVMI